MQPKLYNWVRAIKNISLISAIYSTLVLIGSLVLFSISENHPTNRSDSSALLIALIVSILITISVRKFSLQRLISRFKSTFSFELILASWCILLILLHLQCQLLFLMLFQTSLSPIITSILFIFGALVIYFSWPKLETIQSLLKNTET